MDNDLELRAEPKRTYGHAPLHLRQYRPTKADRHLEMIELVRQYAEEHGDCLIAATAVYKGKNLGQWVAYVRYRHRHGGISGDLAVALESIPGWKWNVAKPGPRKDADRDRRIHELRAEGKTFAEIGDEFNLSRQRIHQIVNRAEMPQGLETEVSNP